MKNINPMKTHAWKKLQNHFFDVKNIYIKDFFCLDKNRFANFSVFFKDFMLIDFSKNRISSQTLKLLFQLAQECYLDDAIKNMFLGKIINKTENRPVLHVALRNRLNNKIILNNIDIMNEIQIELKKIKCFSESIIDGSWKGFTGKSISDVVNIGIGGSYLGPYMITEALKIYKNHLNIHYISNIDGTEISEVLKKINLETTIFLIASKSFSTDETISNANYLKKWCILKTNYKKYFSKHFFALCENIKTAINFGIKYENIFKFWDWVGGRYSLWSSSGLSIVLSIGFKNFESLLYGAYLMDQHFLHTKISKNIPIILALISIWYTNFFNTETEAIFPYDKYLHVLPEYLQQSYMESNGKSIDRNGKLVTWNTCPIIWGSTGTNGQHSFFQLLHQGTTMVPCDFIIPAISHNLINDHHKKLLSNFLAQTASLAFGNINKDIMNMNLKYSSENFIFSHKTYFGNKPSNSIFLKKITPISLGSLIALYEHKIFVQGVILNIFSFDQWGVELGKTVANNIYNNLFKKKKINVYDCSTIGLINLYKYWNRI
ncbi:glucose-6-phosphate isomerase [Buchnera aphidicola]|uniref:Glucose-6-phosphate isomerase n=1 Tax=Buchnera aphidicola subsp. Cinara cedri (strain Cc) TaxID=372461 RepID=G6PI_BUCCC|nr:glucose-6-phosphate isomerase [Buchnera aphidicola]Q056X6.1 RecName: Full=Glucose-6-phosphate isomerase; Short=GPI; AltName: Full=Phosphoglucose isomerase; Short=PGI; AltName: Full=Phosphohexose isomerase; Short=PHI [Buchnera aphidicola BCc]ABJ90823.1 glucose-6-phosphate isomerase [Buchnera aphidicola BCc]